MTTEPVKKEKKVAVAHVVREHKAEATHKVAPIKAGRYIEAVGRRKTAIARVRIFAGDGNMTVNDKDVKKYFVSPRQSAAAIAPFIDLKVEKFDASAHVRGGGIHAQAEAIRLGLARALVIKDPEWKKRLRTIGFLTRDSRMVERKKYGLKKARRAPQWAKR